VDHLETSESEGVGGQDESCCYCCGACSFMISDWQLTNLSSPNVLSAATTYSAVRVPPNGCVAEAEPEAL